MTAPASDTALKLEVRARSFALAWLNTFLATSDDDSRPMLFQTICVELFPTGVQLIATSGHLLLRSWVPTYSPEQLDAEPAPWPELEEAPERSVIAVDADGFGVAFARNVLRLTGEDGMGVMPLTLTTVRATDSTDELFLSEMLATENLLLAAFGQRTTLRLFEDKYPNWRQLEFGVPKGEYVDAMRIAPKLLALVGKIRGARSVDTTFAGTDKAITLDVHGDCPMRGLLMPMRKED